MDPVATAADSAKKPTLRRAVVVDSHPLWVEAMTRLLERVGIDVAATSTNGSDMVDLVRVERPDVVVVGLGSGHEDERMIDDTKKIRRTHPQVKVVMIAPAQDDHAIEAAFAIGVSAYCMKSAEPEDLMVAIRQSFERSIFLGGLHPGALDSRDVSRGWEPGGGDPSLTKREVEILRLVAEGHSNVRIAKLLWVTDQTVKFHLSNIYRKLNVANRTEASRWAQLHGVLAKSSFAR
jgi:DNA-binding NarL/FixJ family response regulator